MIFDDDHGAHLTDDEQLTDRLTETPAQRRARVANQIVDAETASAILRYLAPVRRKSKGVSRPCDECKATKRCKMHVDHGVIVYMCATCARALGFLAREEEETR